VSQQRDFLKRPDVIGQTTELQVLRQAAQSRAQEAERAMAGLAGFSQERLLQTSYHKDVKGAHAVSDGPQEKLDDSLANTTSNRRMTARQPP